METVFPYRQMSVRENKAKYLEYKSNGYEEEDALHTVLSIQGNKFLINGKLTYSEIPGTNPKAHGLLMNARFIQGIFDDQLAPQRFTRFGQEWDADRNTDNLIAALPEWYKYGLRAFTVGFQGGGPCFTIPNSEIQSSPYAYDGSKIDYKAINRMERIIMAADKLGMVVIVSCFYSGQIRYLRDDDAVLRAVKQVANWLRDQKFTNVILEIANEHNLKDYEPYPSIRTEEGMCKTIQMARKESGGIPVGSSTLGISYSEKVAMMSDVNIIHGNNLSRQQLYNKIMKAKQLSVPVLCNEDSQAVSRLGVTFATGVSWGYYNNLTKQEPPTKWGIQKGEDLFFAYRMAEGLGIPVEPLPQEDWYYLQGLEPDMIYEGKRWIRMASLYPETIDHVCFYKNDRLVYIAYDDPFLVNYEKNWQQGSVEDDPGAVWRAEIKLASGDMITRVEKMI